MAVNALKSQSKMASENPKVPMFYNLNAASEQIKTV